jgi:hypothetical protein
MKRCTDCMSIANRPQADLQVVCETDVDGKRRVQCWVRPSRMSGRQSRGSRVGMRNSSLLTKTLSCPDMTRMEKSPLVVWKHPDDGKFHLPWRLSQECACIEDRMHSKVRVIRGGIKGSSAKITLCL